MAKRDDITAGTPGHKYFVERQWKCLKIIKIHIIKYDENIIEFRNHSYIYTNIKYTHRHTNIHTHTWYQ